MWLWGLDSTGHAYASNTNALTSLQAQGLEFSTSSQIHIKKIDKILMDKEFGDQSRG